MAVLEPKIDLLGSYGLTPEFEYQEQGSGLRILKELPRRFDLDLLDGYTGDNEHTNDIHAHRDKIGNLLTWMIDHKELANGNNLGTVDENQSEDTGDCTKPFNVDIVCGNGVFHEVLIAPFEDSETEFLATKYKGIIFIRRIEKEKIVPNESIDLEQERYAGLKFPELVTEKVDPGDDGQRCYNVLRTTFKNHTLLYSCQVECIKEYSNGAPKSMTDFVELKTCYEIYDRRNRNKFTYKFLKYKSLKWWTQIFMTGIQDFFVGIKNVNTPSGGIHCNKIIRLTMDDLISDTHFWTPFEAMASLDRFLSKIKNIVIEDNPDIIYSIKLQACQITHEILTAHDHSDYVVLNNFMIETLNEISL